MSVGQIITVAVVAPIGLLIIAQLIVYLIKEQKNKIKIEGEKVAWQYDESLALKRAKDMSELIQIPTVTGVDEEFDRLDVVLKDQFPNVFAKCESIPIEDAMLLKYKGKSDKKPLVLMGHRDVVPADKNGWVVDPFAGVIKDGYLYGRGTVDCKNNVFGILSALEELAKNDYVPKYDIYFSSSVHEEVSGPGTANVVDYMEKENIKPYLVLDEGGCVGTGLKIFNEERDVAVIGMVEKGYVDIECKIKSQGGHSSQPPKNDTAQRMAKFILDVHKNERKIFKMRWSEIVKETVVKGARSLPVYARFFAYNLWLYGPLFKFIAVRSGVPKALFGTTAVFTQIKGGEAINVIPKEIVMNCNLRVSPFQGVKESVQAFEKIAKKHGVETRVTLEREASTTSSTDSDAYKLLENEIARNFNGVNVVPYMMLGGTDSRFFGRICDNVLRFAPFELSIPEVKSVHSVNERIKIRSISRGIDFYRDFIKKYNQSL